VANRTTTTESVYSEKNADGGWDEVSKTVTTTTERDDEGYPYGPIRYNPYDRARRKGPTLADYFSWYSLGAYDVSNKPKGPASD
jgi:hypothetical protein